MAKTKPKRNVNATLAAHRILAIGRELENLRLERSDWFRAHSAAVQQLEFDGREQAHRFDRRQIALLNEHQQLATDHWPDLAEAFKEIEEEEE